ncbi:hypothetical protein HY086_00675 [Candidatus Gottesmanbacteria bacterium]|nr:hypothetical protein [Candidatus Gottesmanbacteria bacterium]
MAKPVIPIRSSTQEFTEIEDIDHDIVLFQGGSCALVVATTAVNFGLLSEREQEAMIYAYAGFLNSLSFPVQIIIRSQHKDITHYLNLLQEQEAGQKNPKLAKSIHAYRLFVAETVKEKEVLDKKFYIVVPFSNLELGPSTSVLFGSKKKGLPYPKDYIFERALTVLTPKTDHVLRLLARVGLRGRQLTTEQLIRYFFIAYNPDSAKLDLGKIVHGNQPIESITQPTP